MTSSRFKSSRVAVLLLGGVSVVVTVMYLHLASEVAQLHTSMYPSCKLIMSLGNEVLFIVLYFIPRYCVL